MKLYSVKFAMLLVIGGISICLAGEEKKKCPPEDADLEPVECDEKEGCKDLVRTWKMVKCAPSSLFCDNLSCLEITHGKAEKGFYFHGSAYNESSSKVWASTGFLTLEEPGGGVFKGVFEDERANGKFYYLLLTKKMLIKTGCFENGEFAFWVFTKDGKLESSEEEQIEEILEKNELSSVKLKHSSNKDCAKLKSSIGK